MKTEPLANIIDEAQCKVIGGVHAGKPGTIRDIKTGKTGNISITVVQSNGERFKTLAKEEAAFKVNKLGLIIVRSVQIHTKISQNVGFQSGDCTKSAAYSVGQTVMVNFDAKNPQSSQVQHFSAQFSVASGLAIIGLIIGAVGTYFSINARAVNEKLILKWR